MPPNTDPSRDDEKSVHRPDDNPFITFRRFVDDQFRTLWNMSSSSFDRRYCEGNSRHETRTYKDDPLLGHSQEHETNGRLRNARDPADINKTSSTTCSKHGDETNLERTQGREDSFEELELRIREQLRRQQQEMWRGAESFFRGWFGDDERHEMPSSRSDILSDILGNRFFGTTLWSLLGTSELGSEDGALQYLLFNQYSPLLLERDNAMTAAHPSIPWREAFEDLIRVQGQEKIMPPQERLRQKEDSMEWLARIVPRLQQPPDSPWRGLVSITNGQSVGEEGRHDQSQATISGLPSVLDVLRMMSDGTKDNNEKTHPDQYDEREVYEQQNPDTELDVYERFLGDRQRGEANRAPQLQQDAPQKQQRPSILSTLTTTEKTVAPDGTVTTKVVLKKRFADGREESSETVHTTNGSTEEHQALVSPSNTISRHLPVDPGETKSDADQKRKGWFWSS